MVKEKRILSYFIGWLLLGYIILFIGTNNVFAATYDTFDVTWYYRDMANESNLLNVVKDEETPFYKATDEYVNGFTTRIEQPFSKDIQYIINYKIEIYYYINEDAYFRDDTIDRIIQYSWVDSDFKLLNTTAKQTKYDCQSASLCTRTISITQQVLTLNNTSAIRFGVYTTENKSIGFYNSTQQINYLMLNNITIDENANATIVDQNNQIIQGQDDIINNNKENTQAIIDSNKETQDVIKDQFNECRPSYNLINYKNFINMNSNTSINIIKDGIIIIKNNNSTGYGIQSEILNLKANTTYSISTLSLWDIEKPVNWGWRLYNVKDNTYSNFINSDNYIFTTNDKTEYILYYYIGSPNTDIGQVTLSNIMLNEGSTAKSYEPYGEEICSNRLDETNDKLDGIQGALTDSSAPNTSGLENSAGWLPAGPLDSILNLPLTMLNSLTNSLGKTCAPLNLTLPYVNKNIQIPCLSTIFAQITGVNGLWTWVGTIASVLILYNYLLNLYAWVDRVLTLRAEFDEAMGADLANWGRL